MPRENLSLREIAIKNLKTEVALGESELKKLIEKGHKVGDPEYDKCYATLAKSREMLDIKESGGTN